MTSQPPPGHDSPRLGIRTPDVECHEPLIAKTMNGVASSVARIGGRFNGDGCYGSRGCAASPR